MLKLYFTTALRNFKKNKAFAVINLLGLSLGIATSILIFIVVSFELSFDRHHTKYDNIYRLNLHSLRPSGVFHTPACPAPAAEAMNEFPEVLAAALVQYRQSGRVTINLNDDVREFQEEQNIAFVDSRYFEVFDYNLASSGSFDQLDEPNKLLVTREYAAKYFPELSFDQVIGQTIIMDDNYQLQIAGILDDIPNHTDLPFQLLVSAKTLERDSPPPNWMRIESNVHLYLHLADNIDTDEFDKRINEMLLRQTGESYVARIQLHLQPFSTVHYDERFGNFNGRTVSKETIWAIAFIGVILLLTACINFINLATAQSVKRAKEVGIRKVMGSNRTRLVYQVLSETTLMVLIAMAIGLLMSYIFLPTLAVMMNLNVDVRYFNDPRLITFMALLTVLIVFLSGLYPGWVFSRFDPLVTLKGNFNGGSKAGLWLRRVLVTFQFASSQALIIGTIVVTQQMDYFMSKDLGFNKESVLLVQLPEENSSYALSEQWSKLPAISNISLQSAAPSSPNRWMTSYTFPNADPNDQYFAELKMADEAYLDTYEIALLAGRNYHKMDTAGEVLINEKMSYEMGFDQPSEAVGEKVEIQRGMLSTIVGVVGDFHTVSLQENMIPVAIAPGRINYSEVGIRFKTSDIGTTVSELEALWDEVYHHEPFEYQFLEESIARFYENERRVTMIFKSVSMIAMVIGVLGLYGLVTFIANSRMKEVGIRKVLGASMNQIIVLFSTEFISLIIAAFFIAGPMGYYYMDQWLLDFAYRIDISAWVFFTAISSSFIVAYLTISYRSIVAARSNPVEVLRYE